MLSGSVNTILRLVSNHHWSRFMEHIHIEASICSPKSPPSHLDIARNLILGMLKRRSRSQTTNFGLVEKPRRHEAASFTTSPKLSSCSKGWTKSTSHTSELISSNTSLAKYMDTYFPTCWIILLAMSPCPPLFGTVVLDEKSSVDDNVNVDRDR